MPRHFRFYKPLLLSPSSLAAYGSDLTHLYLKTEYNPDNRLLPLPYFFVSDDRNLLMLIYCSIFFLHQFFFFS